MRKRLTAVKQLCFVLSALLALARNHNSDGLIINHVPEPTAPSEFRDSYSTETEHMIQRKRTPNYKQNAMGTHHRWTGFLLLSLLSHQQDDAFRTHLDKNTQVLSTASSTSLTIADSDEKTSRFNGKSFEPDKVERILDANTIQLKKKGVVKLAGVRMPSVGSGGTNSNFQFPTCYSYSPSYKIRQLLPKKTSVKVQTVNGVKSNDNIPQVVLIRTDDSLVVNEELVKTGFAVVKNGFAKQQSSLSPSVRSIIDADNLAALQDNARSKGLGIFLQCNAAENGDEQVATSSFVADFEPLERSVETVYLSDGGKQQVRDETLKTTYSKENPPKNPRDTKGCSDFETYEDALQWFEAYQPYYGDVAKLDRDGDGVPCPGLPHTANRERYRMKVPTANVGIK